MKEKKDLRGINTTQMKRIQILLLFICIPPVFIFGCTKDTDNNSSDVPFGKMEVFVFSAGKADAILVTTEKHTVLIDTGKDKHGQVITDYLAARGITVIDYLIITHFDKDHIGGADKVIRNLTVKKIIVPDYKKDSEQYRQFIKAANDTGTELSVLRQKTEFKLDSAEFVIYPSMQEYYDYSTEDNDDDDEDEDTVNENNFSAAVRISHGSKNFLFTGDAKAKRLKELLADEEITNIKYDFLKVPHHGRHNKSSTDFISRINPEYAVITCSEDSPADSRVLEALEKTGAKIYLTTSGNIRCTSDGCNLTVQIQDY